MRVRPSGPPRAAVRGSETLAPRVANPWRAQGVERPTSQDPRTWAGALGEVTSSCSALPNPEMKRQDLGSRDGAPA